MEKSQMQSDHARNTHIEMRYDMADLLTLLRRLHEALMDGDVGGIKYPSEWEAAAEGWFREQYGRYGRLRHKLPVEAWYVDAGVGGGKVRRVTVVRLRGAGADYYESGDDYADFYGGRHGLSNYLFPIKGFRKPAPYKIRDKYGLVTRYFGFRRGKNPKSEGE